MLTCLALTAALAGASLTDIPALAAEVETGARALTVQTEISPALIESLTDFSSDSLRLSNALRAAGVTQDLPCIFRGIAEDAHDRIDELSAADTAAEQAAAFSGLRALLDDAILLAPMAAGAAVDGGEYGPTL